MSAERTRERYVHRYYQTWLDSSLGYNHDDTSAPNTRHHSDGTTLRPSNDKALIAFAQLGCLRMGTKRGLVSLISSTREYIVAEATKSVSLETGFPEDDREDDLWFGNASIARDQGIAHAALDPPNYSASDTHGRKHTAAALIVSDSRQHSIFKNLAFAGKGVTFYAGVPLISKAGYHIGVYALVDDRPRDGISRADLIFMQEMARIIMAHFEVVFNDAARHRGERLVVGLGNFLQGMPSMLNAEEEEARARPREGNPDTTLNVAKLKFKGMSITNADPGLLSESSTSRLYDSPLQTPAVVGGRRGSVSSNEASEIDLSSSTQRSGPVQRLFGRAANILKQCTVADGVVFYDASLIKVREARFTPHSRRTDSDFKSTSSDNMGYGSGSTASEDDATQAEKGARKCSILGHSLDISKASTASMSSIQSLALTERVLRRFIRRYPKGKVFHFTVRGDMSHSSGVPDVSDSTATDAGGSRTTTRDQTIAVELIHAMPGARSIVWLPLWDYGKQRWSAGMFAWSRRPYQLLAAQDDITYLKTFGNSIMQDSARLDAQSLDEAKSTFIANISHELRSPLHGILGSTEFLQETALNGFQSSMAHAIETCAKTLLDTVEHVLDYSKINQLSSRSSKQRKLQRKTGSAITSAATSSNLTQNVDLVRLVEEAIEATYAGQTFRPARQRRSTNSTASDTMAATPDPGNDALRKVRILLEIEQSNDWHVRTEPGALRRILMNIVGNALKYTTRGTISILVTCTDAPDNHKAVCFKIEDSGRGMSEGFLRDHAFTPFTQESHLIVNSLGGQIRITSKLSVGTAVTVNLKLPKSTSPTVPESPDDLLRNICRRANGMTLCILNPPPEVLGIENIPGSSELCKSIHKLSSSWFGMTVTEATSMTDQATDFFLYPEPPSISYLVEHHGHNSTNREVPLIILTPNAYESAALAVGGMHQITSLGHIIEIISQPCGPHQLASALHRCFSRLEKLGTSAQDPGAGQPVDDHVVDKPGLRIDEAETLKFPEASDTSQASSSEKSHTRNLSPVRPGLNRQLTEGVPASASTSSAAAMEPTSIQRTKSAEATPAFVSPPASPVDESKSFETRQESRIPSVLVVDDNNINLQLLVAFVKKAGHPYVTATDGLQAVNAFEQALNRTGNSDVSTAEVSSQSTEPDDGDRTAQYDDDGEQLDIPSGQFKYVVMDISMPVMDGIEATRQMRQLERKKGSRQAQDRAVIIALTGLGADTTRQEMMRAGADYYLCKPVKFRELIALFKEGTQP